MKLAIVSLTDGGMSLGYRKYLLRILPLLRQNPDVSELHVLLPAASLPKLEDVHSFAQWHTWNGNSMLVGRWVRQRVESLGVEVVYIPSQRFVHTGLPTVVTVQNMEPLVAPLGGNPLSETLRHLARRLATWNACRRADRVIAISQHVKSFLTNRWNIPEKKIGVVYHGVDDLEEAERNQLPDCLQSVVPGRFLLTIGSIRPARGLEDAIEALPLLTPQWPQLQLAIIGAVEPRMGFYWRRLQQLVQRYGLADRVVWAGSQPEKVVNWCYRNCALFIMTTRSEALSIIALEAMKAGCVCVVTEVGALPELFQQNAFFYRAEQPGSLAEQLRKALLLGDSQRTAMVEGLRRRAAEFTWQRTADLTLLELRRAIQRWSPPVGTGT